jgi:hypothetical protein
MVRRFTLILALISAVSAWQRKSALESAFISVPFFTL